MNKIFYLLNLLICLSFIAFEAQADSCWKDSAQRGIGKIPSECSFDQEKSGLLCYEKCKAGYSNFGGVCRQECPKDWRDDGLFCNKPENYTRGTLWASMEKCQAANPEVGCEKSWGGIYPKCKEGFVAHVATECSPKCPEGFKDIGISCEKPRYIVKPITPRCAADKQYDAGLCYGECPKGFNGIGPVCWAPCPEGMTDCGALCASSAMECVANIAQMIMSFGNFARKAAETVQSFGLSTMDADSAKAALQSAAESMKETAIKISKKLMDKVVPEITKQISSMNLEESAKELLPKERASKVIEMLNASFSDIRHLAQAKPDHLKEVLNDIISEIPNISPELANELATMAIDPQGFDFKAFIVKFDPIGIGKIVEAFDKKICGKE